MSDISSSKPHGGIIRAWCRHILSDLTAALAKKNASDEPIAPLEFITGEVVEDRLNRWCPGDAMRSSWVVNFNEDTLVVETLNTIYQLDGPGRISDTFPYDYAAEVGKSVLLLSEKAQFQEDSNGDIIYRCADSMDDK